MSGSPTMLGLRTLLAAGYAAATLWAAAHAVWEARVTPGDDQDVMELGRHPIWSPPAKPEQFTIYTRAHRTESRPLGPGEVVRSTFTPTEVALEASVLAWPATMSAGLLYVLVRGRRRNLALHCAGTVAVGQCLALVACVASLPFWVSVGGWPHLPRDIFTAGFLAGAIVGVLTYSPAVVTDGPSYVGPVPAVLTANVSPSGQRIPRDWPGVG